MVRTIDKATLTPTATSRLFGDVGGVTGNFTPPTLMGPVTGVINAVGQGMVANSVSAATANSTALAAAIAGGRQVLVPALSTGGSTVYYLASTLTLATAGTVVEGTFPGGIYLSDTVVLKAAPGFTGPLVKFAPVSGDAALALRNIKLDGNNEAGLTALVEYANGAVSSCFMDDVIGVNAAVGILTGDNIQSVRWNRLEMLIGITTGLVMGKNNRHIVATECRLGGTTGALYLGADNTTSADKCQSIHFLGCELYIIYSASGSPDAVARIYNAQAVTLRDCWVEIDSRCAAINALVVLGTASSQPYRTVISGGPYIGNSKASYGVEIVNALYPVVEWAQRSSMLTANLVKNTMLATGGGSGGVVLGGTVDDATGLALALGDNTLANPQHKTKVWTELAAGTDNFAAYVTGEANPRYALRNNVGLRGGPGSTAADATFGRITGGHWQANNRIQALGGLATNSGTTASRPTSPFTAQSYYDTTLGKPIWYDGANWVDATGAAV